MCTAHHGGGAHAALNLSESVKAGTTAQFHREAPHPHTTELLTRPGVVRHQRLDHAFHPGFGFVLTGTHRSGRHYAIRGRCHLGHEASARGFCGQALIDGAVDLHLRKLARCKKRCRHGADSGLALALCQDSLFDFGRVGHGCARRCPFRRRGRGRRIGGLLIGIVRHLMSLL